ncbi:MAG: hypothetical protein DLM55_00835 [Acidimicrobiales bacterium]|nr:MAG: hypothetical protein DLM55_00835 [Acidimicrobiales bacterium]
MVVLSIMMVIGRTKGDWSAHVTAFRVIPPSLAPVLTELELVRPPVVTASWLDQAAQRLGVPITGQHLAARLRKLGWLLPLRVRGVWEFAPADRAGPLAGGDGFIELRAALVARPDLRVGVGYESAAFLRGLATRQPKSEVIVADEGTSRLQALSDFRRVDVTLPESAYGELLRLRVQTPTGILAAISIRPDGFGDWPGLGEWLRDVAARVETRQMIEALAGRAPASWARASYLLHKGGAVDAACSIAEQSPTGSGPFYLGPRRAGGHYDRSTDVVDTVVDRYDTARQGI